MSRLPRRHPRPALFCSTHRLSFSLVKPKALTFALTFATRHNTRRSSLPAVLPKVEESELADLLNVGWPALSGIDGEVRIGGPGISAVAKCGQVGQMRVTRWIEGDERAVQQSKFVSVQTAGAINVGRGKVSAGSRLLDAKVLRSQRDEGRTVERGVNVAGDSHEQIGALLILATRHRPDLEPNPLQGVILPAFGRGRKRRSGGKRMFGAEWPESVVHFSP